MDDNIPEVSVDDSWIFEELGSPIKSKPWPVPMQTEADSAISSNTSNREHSGHLQKLPDELLKRYADNMRKLIITARKQISDQAAEIRGLKRKFESSGIVQCPSCSHHFKEINHRVLPKYMKVFRGRMMVEVEFSSLDHMAEWLTLNGLDVNSDGLPTMVPIEPPKLTLENTNSLLPELVKQIVKEKSDSHSLNPKCHLPSGNAGFSSDIDSNIYKNTSQEDILTKKNDIVAGDMSSSTESRLLLRTGEISKASSSSSHNRKIYDEKMDRRNRSYLEKSDKLPNDRSKYESNMKNVRKDKDGRFRRSDDRKLVGEKMYHGENPDIRSDRTLRRTQDHGRKREIVKSYTSRRYERSKGRDHEPQDSLQKKRRVEGDRKRKRSPIYDENKRKPLQPANKDEIKPRRSEDEYTENGRCTRNNELNFDNEEYEYNDGLSDPELVVVDDTELEDGEIE